MRQQWNIQSFAPSLFRLELSHSFLNTSHTLRMRLKRPTVEYSGLYECKVSTFHEEKTSTLNMIVFGMIFFI